MLRAGSVAVANGNGNHTCTKCHTDDPTLCDERECSSNEVCSGEQGTTQNQQQWVEAICLNRKEV